MKVSRLLEILTILLQREKITAPELAERLEVSARTIRRDIDALCLAGIPVITRQGAGGGISVAEGYRLDERLLSPQELKSILAGLQGLDSVNAAGDAKSLLDRLGAGTGGAVFPGKDIIIDLASYYKESLSIKIALLKKAIADRQIVAFDYYYEKGRQRRRVEPYSIVFKWTSWYLFAWCLRRSDFRTFKLNRLWDLGTEAAFYSPRPVPAGRLDYDELLPGLDTMVAVFDASVEYMLVEIYGPESYRRLPDGRLYFERGYTHMESMVHWILSFGSAAEVLDPAEMREAVAEEARKMARRYESPPSIP